MCCSAGVRDGHAFEGEVGGANDLLVTHDATGPEDSIISAHTNDVEAAYDEEARELV
jgi:hypothetical protein